MLVQYFDSYYSWPRRYCMLVHDLLLRVVSIIRPHASVDPLTRSYVSICYPVIFSVATADLGSYAKIGSGVVALGVSGGAAYPSIQGAVSDHVNTWRSFFIPLTGFVPLMVYGFVMWIINSRKYGGKLTIWGNKVSVKRLLLS